MITYSNPTQRNSTKSGVRLNDFNSLGYVVYRNFITPWILDEMEKTIHKIYSMQLGKIVNPKEILTFDDVITYFESADKEAAYQASKMLMISCKMQKLLYTSAMARTSAGLIGCPDDEIFYHGPAPMINIPNSKRLLYRWHSESHYSPKRRNFVNAWFPIFGDKDETNGTMYVCPGSHKKQWHFAEYQGYDAKTLGKQNHYIQFEIPENELKDFDKVPIVASRGDVVMFHQNLVHASSPNESNKPSYALAYRFYDYRNDLTLSAEQATHPYTGKDYGRPQMLVGQEPSIAPHC